MIRGLFVVLALALMGFVQSGYSWTGQDIKEAIEKNNLNKLKVILNEKTDPNLEHGSWSGLLVASRHQNIEAANLMIAAGGDPNMPENDGWTALHFAVALNDIEMCKVLINAGADILKQNKNGQFPLAMAEEGSNSELKALFQKTLKKNQPTQEKNPVQQQSRAPGPVTLQEMDPLRRFIRAGDWNGFRAQFDEWGRTNVPVDFNLQDAAGFTLLLAVVAENPINQQMFDFLLGFGSGRVNFDLAENDGWNALMFLAVHDRLPLIEKLLAAGANPLLANKAGKTPMQLASSRGYHGTAKRLAEAGVIALLRRSVTDAGREDVNIPHRVVELISNFGANPDVVAPGDATDGITPLMLVAIRGGSDGVDAETLVQKGASLYAIDGHGWSVLMYAIAGNHFDVVDKLLKLGAFDQKFFNVVTPDEETPFTVAADYGNEAVINLLKIYNPAAFVLPNGGKKLEAAPVSKKNPKPKTGIRGSKYSPMSYSSSTNRINHEGKNSGITTSSGKKPLTNVVQNKYAVEIIDAVLANNLASVKYYVGDGGDFTYIHKGGYNALLHASAKGEIDIMRYLIASGANANAAENDGWTPLIFAAFQGRMDATDMLLDHGVNACAQNKGGVYAHSMAIGNGHKKVGARIATECLAKSIVTGPASLVESLLKAGANPSITEQDTGKSVLMGLISFPETTPKGVEQFLTEYSFVDVNHVDHDGAHSLFYAVDRADVAVAAVLIAHGADVKKKNKAHVDVLQYAKSRNQVPIVNLIERYPTAQSMQKALSALQSVQSQASTPLSLKDAANALSESAADPSLLMSVKQTGHKHSQKKEKSPEDLKRENEEMRAQMAHIAEKARQEYGNKAKQRAIEEKQHKEKIMEVERKKKEKEQKGFFAKMFGF